MHVYLESFDLLQNDDRNTNKESSVLDTKTTKKTVRQRKPGKQARNKNILREKKTAKTTTTVQKQQIVAPTFSLLCHRRFYIVYHSLKDSGS